MGEVSKIYAMFKDKTMPLPKKKGYRKRAKKRRKYKKGDPLHVFHKTANSHTFTPEQLKAYRKAGHDNPLGINFKP